MAPGVFPFEGGGCSLEDVYIDLDRFYSLLLFFSIALVDGPVAVRGRP
jgi:hypothetical protein